MVLQEDRPLSSIRNLTPAAYRAKAASGGIAPILPKGASRPQPGGLLRVMGSADWPVAVAAAAATVQTA